eukprot:TRINITY_DN9923_c0_g1_i2.p1 TRINITY_DN9923_c0_g1~~TRINITY_DN9923_c0_g1_i2.p1  ORF type:complete len:312 (+),score=26.22 TRINITY_DN9923_c0_g1_i2:1044-1979(+)
MSADHLQSQFYFANNVTIHYWQTSAPGQFGYDALPILVFLHAMLANGACLAQPLGQFSDRFSVVLPDARGHGHSKPIPERSFTMDNLVLDAVALIRHVSNNSAVFLGGHSMGASTAARIAVEYPHLVTALLLIEPPWNRPPGQSIMQAGWIDEEAQNLSPALILETIREIQSETWEEFISAEIPYFAYTMSLDAIAALREFDLVHITDADIAIASVASTLGISGIMVPTQLQAGDPRTVDETEALGSQLTPAVAKMMIDTYPQGELVFFPGAGHNIYVSAYNWANVTLSFLIQIHDGLPLRKDSQNEEVRT